MNNTLSFSRGIQLLAYFTPILFISFTIMLILMDNSPDTIASVALFILGALILYCINVMVSTAQGNANMEDYSNEVKEMCNNFRLGSFNYFPSLLSNSISFTYFMWVTLIGNMIESKNINMFMFLVFSSLVFNHTYHYLHLKCSSVSKIIASVLLGIGWSVSWYFIVQNINPRWNLFYTSNTSDRKRCGRISKKQFQCKVYKNGKLISR